MLIIGIFKAPLGPPIIMPMPMMDEVEEAFLKAEDTGLLESVRS